MHLALKIQTILITEEHLEGEKEEIAKRMIRESKALCTKPQVRVTVNASLGDPEIVKRTFMEYLKEYDGRIGLPEFEQISINEDEDRLQINFEIIPVELREELEKLKIKYTIAGDDIVLTLKGKNYSKILESLGLEDGVGITKVGNTGVINTEGIPVEFIDSIRGLGLEYSIDDNHNIILEVGKKEEFVKRVLGILVSPTIFEWREDDKQNGNPENDHLRSFFFVPDNLKISWKKDSSEDFLERSFSPLQREHFYQNYLQWYLKAKHTAGDIQSLNSVVTSWLSENPGLRTDVYHQIDTMSKDSERVWKDLEKALDLTFNYERYGKVDILKKLLLAVNIEQITPLITKDRFQNALLASAIVKSALEVANEKKVFSSIMKTSATLRNEFDGVSSITYLAKEQKERVEKALKKLGFDETEDGLQMFRTMWVNFWYLRGSRGVEQTLKITSAGIEISNPKKNMYDYEKRKSETEPRRRKFEGGEDKIIISWSKIRDVEEVSFDLTTPKDFLVDFFTGLASITNKKSRPALVSEIEREGPGSIILRAPGRDEPLCEIFAIHRPQEFWKLLKDLSKLMADEEASADAVALLQVLQKN